MIPEEARARVAARQPEENLFYRFCLKQRPKAVRTPSKKVPGAGPKRKKAVGVVRFEDL